MNKQLKILYCLMLNCEGRIEGYEIDPDGTCKILVRSIVVNIHDGTRYLRTSWVILTPESIQ